MASSENWPDCCSSSIIYIELRHLINYIYGRIVSGFVRKQIIMNVAREKGGGEEIKSQKNQFSMYS